MPVNVTIQKQATVGQLTYSGGALTSARYACKSVAPNGYQGVQLRIRCHDYADCRGSEFQQRCYGRNGHGRFHRQENLTLSSQTYGSSSFVSATALTGSFTTTDSTGATATRAAGTDVQAQINGVQATGNGLQASIDTPSLNLSFNVNSNFNT